MNAFKMLIGLSAFCFIVRVCVLVKYRQPMMFLLLISTAVICFFLFLKKRSNYWKERGVATVDSNPLFGVIFDFLIGRYSIDEIHENIYKAKPNEPYVGVYNLMYPALFIRDPALLYQITVQDFSYFSERILKFPPACGRLKKHIGSVEGDEWKSMRSKLTPSFSPGKIKNMYVLMEECADMLIEQHFRPCAKTGDAIDLKESMMRYSLDVLGTCIFGLQFNTLKESDSLYRETAEVFSNMKFTKSFKSLFLSICPKLLNVLPFGMTSNEMESFFFNLLRSVQEIRCKELQHRENLLQRMLDLKDEHTDENERLFSEDNIAANIYAFHNAAHETVESALTFILYELAMRPEVQDKLRYELRSARESSKNGVLDYETVNEIPYLEMVILETLRLHGPASANSRLCVKTYQVPNSTLEIKAGEHILFSVSGIQKDEKYFPDPLRFDPERFSKENMAQMTPHTYLPFGSGPRICMGLRFAKIEMKICLASIFSHYRLSRCNKTEDPLVLNKGSILHAPLNSVWVSVEEC